MYDVNKIRPRTGWALCRTLKPISQSKGGLVLARDLETGKTTEAVAEVIRVTPALRDDGQEVDPGFGPGDKILIRDFIKYAHAIGDLVGADRNDRVFLMNNKDAFAVVTGSGTLGFYDEFVLE